MDKQMVGGDSVSLTQFLVSVVSSSLNDELYAREC